MRPWQIHFQTLKTPGVRFSTLLIGPVSKNKFSRRWDIGWSRGLCRLAGHPASDIKMTSFLNIGMVESSRIPLLAEKLNWWDESMYCNLTFRGKSQCFWRVALLARFLLAGHSTSHPHWQDENELVLRTSRPRRDDWAVQWRHFSLARRLVRVCITLTSSRSSIILRARFSTEPLEFFSRMQVNTFMIGPVPKNHFSWRWDPDKSISRPQKLFEWDFQRNRYRADFENSRKGWSHHPRLNW